MDAAKLTEVRFQDLSRCVSCGRLVTLRRVIQEGRCKCSAIKVTKVTFLKATDLREIYEDYGDDCIITGGSKDNYEDGLLAGGPSTEVGDASGTVYAVDEARLHSRRDSELHQEVERSRTRIFERNWWRSLPFLDRGGPRYIERVADESRRVQVRGGFQD